MTFLYSSRDSGRRRERSDEALEAMDDEETVVKEIGRRDLHSSDKDLRRGFSFAAVLGLLGGNGYTAAWAQGLYFGTERKLPQIADVEEARNNV